MSYAPTMLRIAALLRPASKRRRILGWHEERVADRGLTLPKTKTAG